VDGNCLYLGADSGIVYTSKDTGKTWSKFQNDSIEYFENWPGVVTSFARTSLGLYMGLDGHGIYRTVNNCTTWNAIPTGRADDEVTSMFAINELIVFCSFNASIMVCHPDGAWNTFNEGVVDGRYYYITKNSSYLYFVDREGQIFSRPISDLFQSNISYLNNISIHKKNIKGNLYDLKGCLIKYPFDKLGNNKQLHSYLLKGVRR